MKKFIYRSLLISLFILGVFAIKSYGASDFEYTLDNNQKATIISYKGSASDLTIPSEIDGYTVIEIGEHAFDSDFKQTNGNIIKNVVVSEGIQKIGAFAFLKCGNLESVQLPESLTQLGMQSFLHCGKLKSINIPSQITGIGSSVFQNTALTEIELSKNVEVITNMAFGSCVNLKKVIIHNDNINIYRYAFSNCSSDLVLYGNLGSACERFANENHITFVVLSNGEDPTPEPEPTIIPITSISLNKTSMSLFVGDTANLIATVNPNNATDKSLVWTSSNENIVTVSNGTIKAREIGTATISVANKDNTIKTYCTVEVKERESSKDTPVDNTIGNTVYDKSNIVVNEAKGTIINEVDNTTSKKEIPQTGDEIVKIVFVISIITIISAIIYWRNRSFKDIK